MERKASVAVVLTPPGSAAIAVVRLTGAKVPEFLRSHFSGRALAGRCVHGELRDGANTLDDPVVVLFDDGDAADVNLHGGPWLVRSVLELASREGFEVIDRAPDENAPLADVAVSGETALQREILASLPLARTELALSELLAQEDAWRRWEQLPIAQQKAEAQAVLEDRSLWWLLHPPRVAIAGAPNVGKSTLANQLFAQERSIAADIPGTTRDWVGEMANIDGLAVMLVDTPGIRATTDPIETLAIERSGAQLAAAELVLLLLDASSPLGPGQMQVTKRYPKAIQVINKCDLLPAWDHSKIDGINLVATTGQGVDVLRAAIKTHFGIGRRPGKAKWWSVSRRKKLTDLLS